MSGHLIASAIHPDPSQEPGKSESTCLAPRAFQLSRSRVFSEAVAAQIEDPQRGSTRSVYETSVPILQVVPQYQGDFRAPLWKA